MMHPMSAPYDLRARLEEAERRAMAQLAVANERFDEIVAAADGVATDDEHDPEGHTIAWERQQAAALAESARSALVDVHAAIARIDDGTYGWCTVCHAPITEARLDALPAVRTCIGCAAGSG